MSDEEKTELELMSLKQYHQRKIAYLALLLLVVVTLLILSPFISLDRVEKLEEILVWFYISDAGIIGAFMGFSSWMSRK